MLFKKKPKPVHETVTSVNEVTVQESDVTNSPSKIEQCVEYVISNTSVHEDGSPYEGYLDCGWYYQDVRVKYCGKENPFIGLDEDEREEVRNRLDEKDKEIAASYKSSDTISYSIGGSYLAVTKIDQSMLLDVAKGKYGLAQAGSWRAEERERAVKELTNKEALTEIANGSDEDFLCTWTQGSRAYPSAQACYTDGSLDLRVIARKRLAEIWELQILEEQKRYTEMQGVLERTQNELVQAQEDIAHYENEIFRLKKVWGEQLPNGKVQVEQIMLFDEIKETKNLYDAAVLVKKLTDKDILTEIINGDAEHYRNYNQTFDLRETARERLTKLEEQEQKVHEKNEDETFYGRSAISCDTCPNNTNGSMCSYAGWYPC